jgi:hypothetical protein
VEEKGLMMGMSPTYYLPVRRGLLIRMRINFRMAPDRIADRVVDRLYVGDIEGVDHLIADGNSLGITAILNMSEYDYTVFVPADSYLNLEIVDGQPIAIGTFWRGMDFLKKQYDAGKTILIHCAYGSSRSVTMLLAFMVLQGLATDMNDAFRQELVARPESAKWVPSPILWKSIEGHLATVGNRN